MNSGKRLLTVDEILDREELRAGFFFELSSFKLTLFDFFLLFTSEKYSTKVFGVITGVLFALFVGLLFLDILRYLNNFKENNYLKHSLFFFFSIFFFTFSLC